MSIRVVFACDRCKAEGEAEQMPFEVPDGWSQQKLRDPVSRVQKLSERKVILCPRCTGNLLGEWMRGECDCDG